MAPSVAEPTTRERLSDQEWRVSNITDPLPPWATLTEAMPGRHRLQIEKCEESRLVVEFVGEPPAWAEPVIQSLQELLHLRQDWDSYGGLPVNPKCVASAIELALDAFRDDTPPPSVVPTSRGGIQLEWHTAGVDLEIEFLSPARICGLFEDRFNDTSWEKDLTSNLHPLIQAISRLSRDR